MMLRPGALHAAASTTPYVLMEPSRGDFEEPLIDFSGPMPYVDAQSLFDEDYPAGELHYYWMARRP